MGTGLVVMMLGMVDKMGFAPRVVLNTVAFLQEKCQELDKLLNQYIWSLVLNTRTWFPHLQSLQRNEGQEFNEPKSYLVLLSSNWHWQRNCLLNKILPSNVASTLGGYCKMECTNNEWNQEKKNTNKTYSQLYISQYNECQEKRARRWEFIPQNYGTCLCSSVLT